MVVSLINHLSLLPLCSVWWQPQNQVSAQGEDACLGRRAPSYLMGVDIDTKLCYLVSAFRITHEWPAL